MALPNSVVPLQHPSHPWIRCSTFALVPKDLGGFCYVEDAQGRRYRSQPLHLSCATAEQVFNGEVL